MGKYKQEAPCYRPTVASKPGESREKTKADSKAIRRIEQQCHEDLIKKKDVEKGKFDRIPEMTPEKLSAARKAINGALRNMSTPAYQKLFKARGIKLESTNYYLAIAIKESGLNPFGISSSNAKGLFQMKTGAGQALDDVNRIFGLNLQDKDVFPIVPKYQEQASKNNALAGILYWHICKDVFRQSQGLVIPKEDQDRAAAFIYKIGIGSFSDLWKGLGAKSFDDFATKLSDQLSKTFPNNFVIPKGTRDNLFDNTYKIGYVSYIYTKKEISGGIIKIGGRDYDASNLVQTLRYAEVIKSLADKQPVAFEIIKPNQWLWGLADKLLGRCTYNYQIPYCQDSTIKNKDKIWMLIETIIRYNREINNPDFEGLDPENHDASVGLDSKVFLPPKEYLVKTLKESEEDVKPSSPEVGPEKPTVYSGKDVKELEKIGNELIKAPSKKSEISIPKVNGEPININRKSSHGRMPKGAVKNLVIHSTEGGPGILYLGQNIHFVLLRNGTLEQIRNTGIAVDHGGIMANSSKKAMWNGDQSPSLHSIGIEVVNPPLGTLIRQGKVLVKKEDDTKFFYVERNGKKVYFTDKAPTKKAREEGHKQAHKERGFTDAQYKTLKDYVSWLGSEFHLRKKDVVAHSMIGTSKYGRGRKSDPPSLDWDRLDLPNNHMQVDQDVAEGRVKANLGWVDKSATGEALEMIDVKGKKYYLLIPVTINKETIYSYAPTDRFGAAETMTAGVKAGDKIWKEKQKKKAAKKNSKKAG